MSLSKPENMDEPTDSETVESTGEAERADEYDPEAAIETALTEIDGEDVTVVYPSTEDEVSIQEAVQRLLDTDTEQFEGLENALSQANRASEKASDNTASIGLLRTQVQELYREFEDLLKILNQRDVVMVRPDYNHRDDFEKR
jgi:hypothetical protein